MGFTPPLKDCVKSAMQTAADAAGGILQAALGTPSDDKLWVLGKLVNPGAIWTGDNPIRLLVEAGFDGLEACLIAGYGEPGGGGPGGEADQFTATNVESFQLSRGSLVRVSGNGEIVAASADLESGEVDGTITADVPATDPAIVRPQGVVSVLLVGGLSPAGGDRLWLSETAGRASTAAPTFPGATKRPVGKIIDASSYVGTTPANSLVSAVLRIWPAVLSY